MSLTPLLFARTKNQRSVKFVRKWYVKDLIVYLVTNMSLVWIYTTQKVYMIVVVNLAIPCFYTLFFAMINII